MGKKITIGNAAGQVRRHLEDSDPDFYAKSGIADSTDEYVVFEILGKKKEDFLLEEPASTNASEKQPVDNTGLTEKQDIIGKVAADSSSQKISPSAYATPSSVLMLLNLVKGALGSNPSAGKYFFSGQYCSLTSCGTLYQAH